MLSRRNVRVKVFQSVYNWFQDKELGRQGVITNYRRHVATSYELLIFNIRNLVLISRMAVKDKANRAKKYLPTAEDRDFEAVLYRNSIIAALESNETFRKNNREDFIRHLDTSQANKLYKSFAETDVYLAYLANKNRSEEDHLDILLELWKFLCHDPLYIELVYDAYPSWIDDDSLIKGFVKRSIKGIAEDEKLLESYKPDRETVEEFGLALLTDVVDQFQEYDQQLIPYLQNWEIERIATVDRILIEMALSEFMKFPSIPTKVTINEYVDIAKMYSTDKSKDFLNGILDALLKDLIEADEVHKEGRGLLQ